MLLAARTIWHSLYRTTEIERILNKNWSDYRTDLSPIDRRMRVLEEKEVSGMSTENVRFLINELVRRFAKDGVYLEVGTYHGCSLLSAALFNPSTRCIGIDDFSQFDPDGKNESLLYENLNKFGNPQNIECHKMDYIEAIACIFSREPSTKIDVYYYDGEHSYENQLRGLESVLPYLSEKCIILVDDTNWEQVKSANEMFLNRNPSFRSALNIKTKGNGSEDWWNGFEVMTRGI